MRVATTALGDDAIHAADTSATPPTTAMTAEQRWIQPRALGRPIRSATVSARPWGRSSTTGATGSFGDASVFGSIRPELGFVLGADGRVFRASPLLGGEPMRPSRDRDDADRAYPRAYPSFRQAAR